jgi:hypothetical protein
MESETMANEKGCQFRLPSNIQIESIIPIWSPFLSKKSTQNNIYSRYFFFKKMKAVSVGSKPPDQVHAHS